MNTLLLVDDNAGDAQETMRKLDRSRLEVGEVLLATSLAGALLVLSRHKVDLILLDLDLEDSRSLDTLRAVRTVTDAVVIILSDSPDEVLGIGALKAGADDFLVKPTMTEESLRTSIVEATTRHRMRQTGQRMNENLEKLTGMGVP